MGVSYESPLCLLFVETEPTCYREFHAYIYQAEGREKMNDLVSEYLSVLAMLASSKFHWRLSYLLETL